MNALLPEKNEEFGFLSVKILHLSDGRYRSGEKRSPGRIPFCTAGKNPNFEFIVNVFISLSILIFSSLRIALITAVVYGEAKIGASN